MAKTEKGYTNVRKYDTYASYNADTERNDATISFVEQDNSIWVQGKQYSMNAGCYVGSDKADVSTTAWYLAGTLNVTAIGWDIQYLGYCTNSLLSEGGGLFVLNLRFNSATDIQIKKFAWLVKTGSTPNLRLVVSEGKVRLYVFVAGGQYRGANIRILTESTSAKRDVTFGARNFFGLSDNTTPETTDPVGTDIADVPYITKTDANNKFLPILATTSLVKNNPNVGYVKFAEIDTKGQYGNKAITLSVSSAYASGSIWNDGLYMINIRGNGASTPTCRAYCFVDYRSGASKIKLYFASSGSKFEFYREVRTAQELTQLGFKVLNVENFENGKNWDFKLIESNKTTSDATFDTPIGTLTEIPNRGQVYFANNANSATKATQDGNGVVIAGNYQRVYKSSFHVTADGWYKLAYRPRITGGLLDWKDKYILVDVLSRQGGSCHASFKILYSSHAGWLATANNEFMCIPLTATNYACISNVRLLSKDTSVSGNSYIELYVQLSKGGVNASTDVEISIESNISNTYLYNTATAGETDTSAYTVITRNAITSPYGGSLAVGGLVAEKSLSTNKLATPRKIGFAYFDGSANLSLNAIQGAFYARWTTNTTQWLRIIRFKTKTIYTRKQLILAVYDIEGSSFSGIVEVTLTVGAQLTTTYAFVNWLSLWAAPNYNYKESFKITATYPTDNDEYVYLDVYANSPYTYKTFCFCVLSCNSTSELTIGNSGEWVEGSALQNVVYQSTTDTSLVTKQSLSATDSAFLQSLEGLCHKSNDSSLDLRRRTEYICGQQVLSDTEEAGKAFYGSSANPLVISVPLKDPADTVAGSKVNVNIIRFYYTETYWQELFFCVNTPNIYTRCVAGGNARPWYRMMKEDSTIEYDAWVTKATTADSATVANKTKYPLIVASGNTQFNWYADSTLKLTIPEEMLASAANGVFVMKVPEIEKAKSVTNNDLSNTTELTLPAIHSVIDGMSLGQSPIKLNIGENSLNVNISGKSATSGTADVANKTKYPLILRQDGTNVVSWFADSTVILDVPSEMVKSATSGGITLARANRTFVAVATGGELFTDGTGGRIITLQNYATFDITPIEGDILILRVVNSIQAQGMYPLVIPYTSANTVAKSIALVRGQNPGGWIDWTTSQLSAGIYQFACINNGTSLRWALISNNTFNAP